MAVVDTSKVAFWFGFAADLFQAWILEPQDVRAAVQEVVPPATLEFTPQQRVLGEALADKLVALQVLVDASGGPGAQALDEAVAVLSDLDHAASEWIGRLIGDARARAGGA